MEIKIDVPRGLIDKLRKELRDAPKGMERAMAGAINKTAAGVKTDTVRAISKAYTVKQKDVRAVLRMTKKATPSSLGAAITGQYKPLPLTAFSLRPRTVGRRRPKGGLTVTVRRGHAYRVRSGFVASLGGQVRAVMRKTKKRFPVRVLYGPTVAKLMAEIDITETVMGQASKRLAVNIDRQTARILKT